MSSSLKSADLLGNVDIRGMLLLKGHTFAQLPSGPVTGMITMITDSAVTTGNVTVGASTHKNVIVYNGTNWVVLFNLT